MKRTCKYCTQSRRRSGAPDRFTSFQCNVDGAGIRLSNSCNSFKRLTSHVIDKTPVPPASKDVYS